MNELASLINLPHFSKSYFENYRNRPGVYDRILSLEKFDIDVVESVVLTLLKDRLIDDIELGSYMIDKIIATDSSELKKRDLWSVFLHKGILDSRPRYKRVIERYFLTNCLDEVSDLAMHG